MSQAAHELEDELAAVWLNRYREALRSGLEHIDATRFAQSETDIGELRRLVEKGCTPGLIARIVL